MLYFLSLSCIVLPLPYIILYPCSDLNINSVAVPPNLIISLHRRLPCGNINDTPVYSRVKCYSGIPCACGSIRGSWNTADPNWHLRVSSLGDVGRRQQSYGPANESLAMEDHSDRSTSHPTKDSRSITNTEEQPRKVLDDRILPDSEDYSHGIILDGQEWCRHPQRGYEGAP